jgi:hypothetical protein
MCLTNAVTSPQYASSIDIAGMQVRLEEETRSHVLVDYVIHAKFDLYNGVRHIHTFAIMNSLTDAELDGRATLCCLPTCLAVPLQW